MVSIRKFQKRLGCFHNRQSEIIIFKKIYIVILLNVESLTIVIKYLIKFVA